MKICFAVNNLSAGGAERVISALANEIALSTDHSVEMVCFARNYYSSRFYPIHEKVELHLVDRDAFEMESLLRDIHPDIVISFLNPMNYVVSAATRNLHIPHVACERNNPYFSPIHEEERLQRDEAFEKAEGCVFQSKSAKLYFSGKTSGFTKTINNPVVLDVKELPNQRENKVVAIGRYTQQKNYFTLLDAFSLFNRLHPDFRLECFGKDAGLLDEIKAYASSMNISDNVTFFTETKDLHQRIVTAKLFLLTSYYEGQSNALAEAAALGIPCVASRIPGVQDLVDQYQFGLLCPSKRTDEIANAMHKVVNDSSLWNQMSQNGKRVFEERRVENIVKQWLDFVYLIVEKC